MGRKAREKIFYNKEFKEEFISQLDKSRVPRSSALFGKSYEFEMQLNKDLSDFSLDEIEEIFRHSESENARLDYYAIKDYLEYCIAKGVINKYVLENVKLGYFDELLDENRLRITKDQLDEYIKELFNVQDKLLLTLLFEGVNGAGQSEIRNLKKQDIDWNTNILQLRCDKNGERTLTVSDECMKLLDLTLKEDTFYYNNGDIKIVLYDKYCENDFVIRSLKKQARDESKRAHKSLIVSRFNDFKKWLNQPKLNPTVIYQSGLIYYAVQFSKKIGKEIKDFRNTEYREIAKQFPLRQIVVNNTFVYDGIYRYFKEDEIKALYGNYLNKNFILQPDENIEKEIIEIKKRQSSAQFRKMIFNIYEGTCAITGEATKEVLDACHIQDYKNEESNHSQNGILLRTDLHTLFDKGLLMIDDNFIITISDKINSEYYKQFNGLQIRLPKKKENHPAIEALRDHNRRFIKKAREDNASQELELIGT